jgi:hypothetical protein
MRLARAIGGLALGVALLAPAAARADLIAAVDVEQPGGGHDVAVLNATTGARLPLPAGVNTADSEHHPSLSRDARRLVFQRDAGGATRIIVVDRTTGQMADLFNGFEQSADLQTSPAISPDGQVVFTGEALRTTPTGKYAAVKTTNLASFPNGPFVHGEDRANDEWSGDHSIASGGTANPSASRDLLLFGMGDPGQRFQYLTQRGGASGRPLQSCCLGFTHGAIAADAPTIALFAQRELDVSDPARAAGQLVLRPATVGGLAAGPPSLLPAIVNTSADEGLPALSPDERYVGFVRASGLNGRLFVWDSQTQTLLNPAGVDLGAIGHFGPLNLSLTYQPLLVASRVSTSGTVGATLLQASGVGLLVQRIVGRHRVLGHRAFKLRKVGRVPLGKFKRGHLHTHWNLKVNGKRLRPGRYLVTVRGVSPKRVVRELGKPKVIRIRRR